MNEERVFDHLSVEEMDHIAANLERNGPRLRAHGREASAREAEEYAAALRDQIRARRED